MPKPFEIDVEWFPYADGDEIARHFSAFIGLTAGGRCLTRLCDRRGKTVRERLYGCAWQLAQWFAANWWRLRWEVGTPVREMDVDWGLSHCLASAGGGFIWPDVVFDSDGETVGIALSPDLNPPPYEPVSYLNTVDVRVPAADFERAIDGFLDVVLHRGEAMGTGDGSLKDLWGEVLGERHNRDASRHRKWEAIAGYDPDDAPDMLMKWIGDTSQRYGQQATEEVVAEARHDTPGVLDAVNGIRSAVCVSMPHLADNRCALAAESGEPPWKQGERMALSARKAWDLGDGPVASGKLAGLLETKADELMDGDSSALPFPLALKAELAPLGCGGQNVFALCLPRKAKTARRFAVSRLLGDHLRWGADKLHPATGAGTARQKFQRAFAADFLCPFDALWEKLGRKCPSEDGIEDAAAYFEVSPLLVRSVLVNKGKLERDVLAQQDAG